MRRLATVAGDGSQSLEQAPPELADGAPEASSAMADGEFERAASLLSGVLEAKQCGAGASAERASFLSISDRADGGRRGGARSILEVPPDASRRGPSGTTLPFDLAIGVCRRHAPKSC